MEQPEPKKPNLNKEFFGQRADEEVILILQRHWFVLAWPFLKGILFIAFALIMPAIGKVGFYIFNSGVIAFVYIVWLIFWVSYLAYEYINWYRDRFIITNQRIVNIDQRSMFSRRVSELEFDRVQDIAHEVRGVFAAALNFGDVIIQSAGSKDMTIQDIARPAELQDIIVRLVKEATAEPPVTAEEMIDFIKKNRT
ncbi:MAG: PH domain-containing protein [Patescibacteria group bacterium]|jgi:uncharacterized membrane protein YdbT with pleckstrin-like domain